MQHPLISVLMPVYNDGQFLEAAVHSVLRQTYAALELIVCDDGSTDGSAALARKLAAGDERVRLLTLPHGGISAARNAGLRAVRGELLANLDADDVALPERLERQAAYLEAHPECVAVGTQSFFIDEEGDRLGASAQPLAHDAIEAELWKGLGTAVTQSTLMMRRAAVLAAGGYDESLRVSEDLDLYLRLLDQGRLANLPDKLNLVRRHCRSVSAVGNRIERETPRETIVRRAMQRRGMDAAGLKIDFPPHPATRAEWHARWAFRARDNGYPQTARKHARRALRYGPWNPWALRALVHVLLRGGKGEVVSGQ